MSGNQHQDQQVEEQQLGSQQPVIKPDDSESDNFLSVITTNVFALLIMAVILILCWYLGENPKARAYNYFVVIIGVLLGWALGMFFSPFSDKEGATFTTIGQTVSVFISGYVVSKLDRFLEAMMFDSEKFPVEIVWWRTGLLFVSLLLTMLTVFSNRAYFPSLEDIEKAEVRDRLRNITKKKRKEIKSVQQVEESQLQDRTPDLVQKPVQQ